MNYYLLALRKYAQFHGRSTRSEFWYFVLFYFVFAIVAIILDNVLGIAFEFVEYGPIYFGFMLVMFLPSLAVTVRRLQDTGKTGWYFLLAFIPLVGMIWLIILLAQRGTPHENKYGPNPRNFEHLIASLGSDIT